MRRENKLDRNVVGAASNILQPLAYRVNETDRPLRLPDDYQGPGICVGDIEYEGPLEEWPPASRASLLRDTNAAKGTVDDVDVILRRVIPRAFRRTIKDSELDPFMELARQAFDEGLSFEKALRRALKGVLCSPEFLYLEEHLVAGTSSSIEEAGSHSHKTIDDFALSSRLSYFLWTSTPDRELLSLAHRGELSKPDVLLAQVLILVFSIVAAGSRSVL